MCVNPSTIENGIQIPCRECWQCRLDKVNDLVGRSIAEGLHSDRSYFVTLTYGRNELGDASHEAATVLTTRDWQRFMKLLRAEGYRRGFSVRYLAMGEYGALHGRAHWHGILHFKGGNVPQWPIDERFYSELWSDGAGPVGFMFAQEVNYQRTKYVCKYILKGDGNPLNQAKALYSRFPPLGHEFFTALAVRHAEQRVPPVDLTYRLPVDRFTGPANQKFRMRGVTAQRFMETFVAASEELGAEYPLGASDLLDDFQMYGRICKHELVRDLQPFNATKRFNLDFEQAFLRAGRSLESLSKSKKADIPSSIGAFFFKLVFDNGSQTIGWAEALRECRDFDPEFDPYASRWAKLRVKYGVPERGKPKSGSRKLDRKRKG